ncbi:2-oxoacid:ferredoxin oxidoreductase subunit beta [Tuwongella immobilis]|uniref:Thiamine pyrophosphate enzyme TPP-binding domain-containing protein n=1 Tax=Tuwongella immobilis TaxID=692036 RepID=A0A6C2YMN0_9BACT|nr:2-oxoacid:ferredoxin oxidoreductase subunit beta [Tuwongella immobilis]VIP02325.1 2-oxoglutarate ferredoxin oxidoreductase subunit beta : Ferrodoxin oxidoreductase beta subunit OS=Blastopirellula marina DSM 3645 GN=DSM3645_04355 PE=4 SV=1: TPP_enzyme_C [Tuwongella immobilis]VTS01061.1 2-oxoglutarate ferredoxin oxidoreductase subunit beta : Ferrodoxin oxidoreductase beta subunit OS=Blastopirellula marina DSM 3645 GN=DSM3645_04355 PE=4 SV=1: TPP_enzyme_C [Tuwongella immobilis]
MSTTSLPTLTAKDLTTDQEVRWCPGCGDYSILAQMKKALTTVGIPREQMVFISGIGCSSRFPYYMNTYGFHTIHGRAPTIASGLRLVRPDLQVWVVTGDGDGLSIGGNHLVHAIRRNMDLKILLFNNEIYGLTKGQYSPTSRLGTKTKSTPQGSLDNPIRPLSLAIGAEATFVARTIDIDVAHMTATLQRAAAHKGTAFVEIYQNCKIFNDGVYEYATDKSVKADNVLYLEHGKPMIFGKDRNKGIRLNGLKPEVVELGNGITADDLIIHDEAADEPTLAYLLSRMVYPEFPECVGVFRAIQQPTYESLLDDQVQGVIKAKGPGKIEDLFKAEDIWVVE